MPKFSDDRLLSYAITSAVEDRRTLADAYSGVGEWADEALRDIEQFKALQGKSLSKLTPSELEAAGYCFICAERYEQSVVDARIPSGRRWHEDAKRRAASFREVRLRKWGVTRIEAACALAGSVSPRILASGEGVA